MPNVRAIAVLAGGFFVTNGCAHLARQTEERTPCNTTLAHRAIGTDVFVEFRQVAGRDVFLCITDANTLIYDYTLESRDMVVDSAARDALRSLLSASPVAPANVSQPRGNSAAAPPDEAARLDTALSAFQEFADSVFSSSAQLVEFVRYSDGTSDASDVNNQRSSMMRSLKVAQYLNSDPLLQARAESLWAALSTAEKRTLLSQKAALDAAIPRIITLHKAIQRATFGELWLHRDGGSADAALVELTVASKLSPDYPGVRWTGKGKDIALVRAAFPRIAWTAGMGGVFRSDRAFHLQPSAADTGKFVVTRSSDSRFAFAPLGMLTVQGPCCRGSTMGGISTGVGLRDGAGKLSDGADLFLMATLGLDWLRVSAGGAYTAEVYDLVDIQPGDLVDSPNALNSQRTKRRLRPAIALHMAF